MEKFLEVTVSPAVGEPKFDYKALLNISYITRIAKTKNFPDTSCVTMSFEEVYVRESYETIKEALANVRV